MTDSLRVHLREVRLLQIDMDKGYFVIKGESVNTSTIFQLDAQRKANISQDFGGM